ncbi:unnamed protein product [Closterium sp. Naga37s-1]|nr:unnamed protein product [Closterium sp. Naga37s-1]
MVDADPKSGESLSEVEEVASDSDDSWAATDLEEDNGDAVSEDVEEQDREFPGVKEVGALDVNGASEDNERSFWEVQFENDEENEDCDDDPDRMKRWSKNATTRAGKKKRKEEEEEEEQELSSLPSEEEEEEEEADEDEALSVRAKRAWRNMKRCSNGDGKKSQKQQKQLDKKRKRAAKAAAWVRQVHLEGEEVEEERMAEWERDLAACNRGEVTPQQLVEKRERPREQEPAPDILMPLLPFQKEWLAWSLKQEQGPIRGGILADEMGMGKTIQAISLIVTSRQLQSHAPAVNPVLPQPLPPSSSAAEAPSAKAEAASPAAATPAVDAPFPAPTAVTATSAAGTQATAGNPGSSGGGASEPERAAVKATLVICPLIAVLQWRQEIARFTRPDSVKVLVYHGPKRAISVKDLEEYDVVLTTFSIVEAEMRAAVFPSKVPCQWCERKFFPDRLEIHQKYFCGPNAKRTAKQAKQQKKLPRSFKGIGQGWKGGKGGKGGSVLKGKKAKWKGEDESVSDYEEEEEEAEDEEGGTWKGKGRNLEDGNDGNGAGGSRGGATTAGHANAPTPRGKKKQPPGKASPASILHLVRWRRIILDEAHSIKDRRCNTARAVFGLRSDFKWALSGTPLQNRVGELYSLIRFLQIDPYSYYFCRHCDCQSLDHKFSAHNRKCDQCGHSPLVHFCWWNKFVANPIMKHGYGGDGRRAMLLLKHRVLNRVLLRRTKTERAADLTLPPRTATLRRDRFDAREEDFYEALYTQSQSQFATYVDTGTLLNNYAHIFDLLIRLRQAVDHPYLVVHSASHNTAAAAAAATASTAAATAAAPSAVSERTGLGAKDGGVEGGGGEVGFGGEGEKEGERVEEREDASVCGICCDYAEDPVVSRSSSPASPPESTVNGGRVGSSRGKGNGGRGNGGGVAGEGGREEVDFMIQRDPGAKALVFSQFSQMGFNREELDGMIQRDPGAKALVFSQFTSMLDLIAYRLHQVGVRCVKLDGSMTMDARDRIISTFTRDADCRVFLMSLKAGGVALNLTVASHVFLMDPWWNPAVEQQAQDRIHRLGQFKPVRVTRFVIAGTIEERIIKLQEKKQLVFDGTVGGSSEALGRLTEDDLRFLFTN